MCSFTVGRVNESWSAKATLGMRGMAKRVILDSIYAIPVRLRRLKKRVSPGHGTHKKHALVRIVFDTLLFEVWRAENSLREILYRK